MPRISNSVGHGGANQSADVRVVQQLLNRFRLRGAPLLIVDGRVGPMSLGAIADFQSRVMLMSKPDSLVSPNGPTFVALCGGQPQFDRIAWGAKVSGGFKAKAIAVSQALVTPVDFLMSAMAFESGETFSASVKNAAGSGAVGLIQFMPSTAKALGTTTEALGTISAEAQLDWVKKYFLPKTGRLNSIDDLYMAILYPIAIGWSANATLFSQGTKVYAQNRGLDANKDGKITVGEAAAAVRRKYEKGVALGYLG